MTKEDIIKLIEGPITEAIGEEIAEPHKISHMEYKCKGLREDKDVSDSLIIALKIEHNGDTKRFAYNLATRVERWESRPNNDGGQGNAYCTFGPSEYVNEKEYPEVKVKAVSDYILGWYRSLNNEEA